MSDQNEKKYKQLALFSVITAEIVVTPCVFGAIAYWFTKKNEWQMLMTTLAAAAGLLIGFYRVFLIYKTIQKSSESNDSN